MFSTTRNCSLHEPLLSLARKFSPRKNVAGIGLLGTQNNLLVQTLSTWVRVLSRPSMDFPTVFEIVDSEEKVNTLLPALDEMMGIGLSRARK